MHRISSLVVIMDTIAYLLSTSDHIVYCHDETTGDTFLIIGEIDENKGLHELFIIIMN